MKDAIIQAVTELDDELALGLVKEALEQGISCEDVLNWLNTGIENVGRLYEESDYFVSDLIMAGFIYKEVLGMEEMQAYIEAKQVGRVRGNILSCTVKDDIHDIGKNIFISVAKSNGFYVYDMGIDVHPDAVIETIEKKDIDILALSGTLTSSTKYIAQTIELLKSRGKRDRVKVIVGGLAVNSAVCESLGADFASKDLDLSIEQCKKWVADKYDIQ